MAVSHFIEKEELLLLPEKAIWWDAQHTLIVSDVHIGKANHFRKAGIPIPSNVGKEDLSKLTHLIITLEVKTIIFLGDLFHSDHNQEFLWFEDWANRMDVHMILIEGNHDVHGIEELQLDKLQIQPSLEIGPFVFTHIPLEEKSVKYNIAGHIHPGITLKGKGRQSLRLPCFWFGKHQAILPAFGNLTGTYKMKTHQAKVYAIVENEVILV